MVTGLGLLAVSAALLIAGAELLTENAAGTARRLRITVFAAAFLLARAEPEEMITAWSPPGGTGRDSPPETRSVPS